MNGIIQTLTQQKEALAKANEARISAEGKIRAAESAIVEAVNATVEAGGDLGVAVSHHQDDLTRSQNPDDRIRAIEKALPPLYYLQGTNPEAFGPAEAAAPPKAPATNGKK